MFVVEVFEWGFIIYGVFIVLVNLLIFLLVKSDEKGGIVILVFLVWVCIVNLFLKYLVVVCFIFGILNVF